MPVPTAREICSDALFELSVLAEGETMSAAQADTMRRQLQRLLNNWNAIRCAVYAVDFPQFTLTPSLNPHTIGPTGTFTVTQRPVSIEGISLILTPSNPAVYLPLAKRDAAWWQAQITPTIEVVYPSDFYYDPTWTVASPNGSIYFWPVPSAAYDVQLQIQADLNDALTLDTSLAMPQGYQDAVTLSLAEKAARNMTGSPAGADLVRDAMNARALIFANNDSTPTLETRDAGMEGPQGGSRADFNWISGGPA